MRAHVWVQPGAKRTEPAGRHGDDPKIRVAARPEDGRANHELTAYLARALGVPKGAITIVTGHTSRRKLLDIPDEAAATFHALFD